MKQEIIVKRDSRKMQSPCLKEVSEVFLHGCCPNPLLGFPEALNKPDKPRNTSSTCRHDFAATTTSSVFPNTKFCNPESIPSLEDSFAEFIKAYPQYSDTHQVDQIRAREYYHLCVSNHICLDYIGIGLFSHTQLQLIGLNHQTAAACSSSSSHQPSPPPQHSQVPFFGVSYKTGNLKTQLLHGGSGCELESAMRKRVMSFLNISEDDYHMVFTANRTSAFKLLAESYPFRSSKRLLTVYDYESEAVEGMIRSSEKKGAKVMSAEFSWPRLRIQGTKLRQMILRKRKKKKKRGLFVFPLHSRVTGARYPYLWMKTAQENGWHILVDACALCPKDMDSFGLSLIRPDFLICSFYKIFGENPSGFGCLFVKKSALPVLEDSVSGGMVSLVSAEKLLGLMDDPSGTDSELEQMQKCEFEGDDPGTSNSFSGPIPIQITETDEHQVAEASSKGVSRASQTTTKGKTIDRNQETHANSNGKRKSYEVECKGLDQVDMLGLVQVSNRSRCLINWLVKALLKLRHPNREETRLVRIYGPKVKFDRGPALAFNVFDWKGEKVDAPLVQKLADRSNISLGCGFLHHITFSDKQEEEKAAVLERKAIASDGTAATKRRDKTRMGITVVTVAFGFLADFEDAYRLWAFLAQFMDADFVEKAKWRYTALNQKTIEV